jgi:ionotropic glutamate receptor
MELREIGLISLWMKQFEPNTKPCYSEHIKDSRDRKTETRQRLSLTNLMGAFAVLAVGYLLSLLIFLAEIAISHWKANSVIVV